MMGFAGMERDTVTGLNLAVNRVQNPGTGRWTSQDPLGFAAGDANLFSYVRNSPTNSRDPRGLREQDPGGLDPMPPKLPGDPIIIVIPPPGGIESGQAPWYMVPDLCSQQSIILSNSLSILADDIINMRRLQNQPKTTAKQKKWIQMEIDADQELIAAIEKYRDYVEAMREYAKTHKGPPGCDQT
jgi:RHS repeat-associated protein